MALNRVKGDSSRLWARIFSTSSPRQIPKSKAVVKEENVIAITDNTIVDDKLSYKDLKEFDKTKEFSFYIETRGEVYSKSEIIGISLFDGDNCYYLDVANLEKYKDIFECDTKKITYDLKKNIVVLNLTCVVVSLSMYYIIPVLVFLLQ